MEKSKNDIFLQSFELLSQDWNGKSISFAFSFKLSTNNFDDLSGFSFLFSNDIAGEPINFEVPCDFSETPDGSIMGKCVDYYFDESLTFDQITNFSSFQIVNPNINLVIQIPTYCGSQDGKNIIVELYSPI